MDIGSTASHQTPADSDAKSDRPSTSLTDFVAAYNELSFFEKLWAWFGAWYILVIAGGLVFVANLGFECLPPWSTYSAAIFVTIAGVEMVLLQTPMSKVGAALKKLWVLPLVSIFTLGAVAFFEDFFRSSFVSDQADPNGPLGTLHALMNAMYAVLTGALLLGVSIYSAVIPILIRRQHVAEVHEHRGIV